MLDLMSFRKKGLYIDGNCLLDELGYVVIDTELTGLNERTDSIVSIGGVKMKGKKIILSETFYRLVNPSKDLTAESIIIHEITPSEVMEQPDIKMVFSEFLKFCGDSLIVGYFVDIDMAFLNKEARRLLGASMKNQTLDISAIFEFLLSKGLLHEKEGETAIPLKYNLYDIAKFFDIPVNGGHNAMNDAFITAQIFQRFIPLLISEGVMSIGELLKLAKKYKGGDRYHITRGMSNF